MPWGGTLLLLSVELQLALKVNRNESNPDKYVVHSNATIVDYLRILLKILKPDYHQIIAK